METKPLSINELKDSFYSLKSNKSPSYNDSSYNVIKKCFGRLCEPLKYLFNLSTEKGVFQDDLKKHGSLGFIKVRTVVTGNCASMVFQNTRAHNL